MNVWYFVSGYGFLSHQVKLTMDGSFHGKLEGEMVQQQYLRNAGMDML
jgi:hypothetical protein